MLTAIHVRRPFLPYEKRQKWTWVAYRACAPLKLASVKGCLLTVFVTGRSVLPSAIRRDTCLFSYVDAGKTFRFSFDDALNCSREGGRVGFLLSGRRGAIDKFTIAGKSRFVPRAEVVRFAPPQGG